MSPDPEFSRHGVNARPDPRRKGGLGRRWRFKLGAAAAAIAALLILGILLHFMWAGIHWEAFERIQMGMTESQVHALLGGPPRNEDANNPMLHFTRWRGERWEIWRGQHFAIAVYFDQDGRVVDKDCVKDESLEAEPVFDRVLYKWGLKERVIVRE